MENTNKIRTVKELADVLKGKLEKQYGGCRIDVKEVTKNNSVKMTGLSISREGVNVSPNIYLDDFFEKYQSGMSLGEICRYVSMTYENSEEFNFDTESFTNFDAVKEKICYKLVNAEKNSGLLSGIPHRTFLDLAIIYYVLVSQDLKAETTITVTNSMLDMWKIDAGILHSYAERNTPELMKGIIFPMDVLFEGNRMGDIIMGGAMDIKKLWENTESVDCFRMKVSEKKGMHIASNTSQVSGAIVMLYDGVLENFAEKIGGDFYILPSSIHEMIFLPFSDYIDEKTLPQMVREINQNEVSPQEVLSDNAYRYFAESGKLNIVG